VAKNHPRAWPKKENFHLPKEALEIHPQSIWSLWEKNPSEPFIDVHFQRTLSKRERKLKEVRTFEFLSKKKRKLKKVIKPINMTSRMATRPNQMRSRIFKILFPRIVKKRRSR